MTHLDADAEDFGLKNVNEIYDYWVMVCESGMGYTLSWIQIRKILTAVRNYFKNKGNLGLAKHINAIILKETEVDAGDWDNIRYLLHREIDPTQYEPTDFIEMIKKKYGSF
jgi:hypothetical protein